ncbi:MAG TPA: GNAT family N-acetyltransferase [Solirubrobacterales bacterium]|nr:GNAT family N-acetyltransferase [Solirubrobacterales bacterium]
MPDAVREAKPGEGARLADVYLSSGRAAWARHLSPVGLSGVTSPAEEWERLISDPDLIILVAERRGQVAALAVLCRSTDQDSDPARVALLDRLYTEPASWRRGLGRGLLEAAMVELRERGFREVTLWTAEWNTSRGFHEALGWALDGATREKTFAGSTFTEVRYRAQVPR